MIRDEACNGGAHEGWQHESAGEGRQHPGPQAIRVLCADDGVDAGDQGTATQILQESTADEHRHVGRESADEQPRAEQQQRDKERFCRTTPVGLLTRGHGSDDLCQQEGTEDPTIQPDAVEIAGDRGGHRGECQSLERHDGDGEHGTHG